MNHRLCTLGALLALAGCASTQLPPQATLERIQDEMARASAREASKPAAPPDAVNRALLPPLQSEPVRLPAPSEPRFDLAVSNAPAQQVFLQIVTGTRYSMLVAPEVSGVVALNLKNVTVREALDALRDLYGYEYTMQGTRIHIQPNTLQTRIFQVNYLAGKRSGTSDTRVISGSITSAGNGGGNNAAAGNSSSPSPTGNSGGNNSGSTQVAAQSSHISTGSDNDFWGELRNTLTAIVGTEGNRKIIVNPLSGVVAVRGFPQDLRNTENYLRMTQLIVERQVMIEAKIIEVQLSDSSTSGVNWSAFRNASSHLSAGPISPGTTLQTTGSLVAGGATAGASFSGLPGSNLISDATNIGSLFGLAFQSPNFAAMLQFLETQGNVQVLSSPRIASINNQKAVLKVGTDEFFVTSVSTTATTSGTSTVVTPTIGVQPFFSGIALDVTPQIDENDQIILHLHPSVSVVAEKQKNVNLGTLGSFQLPLAASTVNESDSVVRVQDGNIVAIGGLMKQQQSNSASGLPGSTDSALGALVGTKSRSGVKSELVILLKPTIIRNERSWQADAADTQERLSKFAARAQ